MRLEKSRVKYDLRKFGFSNRVVNTWNSLPNWVVSANILTRLKQDWINFGIIKISYIISEHSCKEPEVVVSVYVKNISK